MRHKFIFLGSLFSMLAVVLGAFGAHILKERLGSHGLDIWKTAVLYQFIHAISMVALASHVDEIKKRRATIILSLFTIGIVLFSGSLYILSMSEYPLLRSIMGPLTPIGGISFILGWFIVMLSTKKQEDNSN